MAGVASQADEGIEKPVQKTPFLIVHALLYVLLRQTK